MVQSICSAVTHSHRVESLCTHFTGQLTSLLMVGAHIAVSPALPHLRTRVMLSFGPKQQSMQSEDKLAGRQKGQWIRDVVFQNRFNLLSCNFVSMCFASHWWPKFSWKQKRQGEMSNCFPWHLGHGYLQFEHFLELGLKVYFLKSYKYEATQYL